MNARIHLREGVTPQCITNEAQLVAALESAEREATRLGRLNMIQIEAQSGDMLSVVVGSHESCLGFTSGTHDPPYFASHGTAAGIEPVLTCYLLEVHHTELHREWVVPRDLAFQAALEFLRCSQKPECLTWVSV